MAKNDSKERIGKLLVDLLHDYDPSYGFGSMSCSVYDTAWVACVSKTVAGCPQWLFPSSFAVVLQSQLPNGGWPAHPDERDTNAADGLLTTLAALYCLTQHAEQPLQLRHLHGAGIAQRISSAIAYLSKLLNDWQVGDCKAVGFEVLAPALLDLLQEQGIHFQFPDKAKLLQIRNQKLTKLPPQMLYEAGPFALLHSLEAFHGHQDFSFDRVSHQKVGGSMMASPSATASYLIRSKEWDDEAEAYLRLVISNGDGQSSGGVPSAYPSMNFEMIWVASTLLEAGLWTQDDWTSERETIIKALQDYRKDAGGLVGFAPGIEPDLDDSAKASIVLSLFGGIGFTRRMVEYFDSSECLRTYSAERHPSVSANCNALLSIILDSEEYPMKIATIEKVTTFICDKWWDSCGSLDDKWNTSPYYPAMLMARSLTELVQLWNCAHSTENAAGQGMRRLSQTLLRERVIPTLFQCLIRTLQSQHIDGSWGHKGPNEESAYAILALASLLSSPLARFFRPEIISAIDRGRTFLKNSQLGISVRPEYLWIEKVTYRSTNLAEAYIVAALYTSIENRPLGPMTKELSTMQYKELAEFGALMDKGPLSKNPKWIVLASWIDSRLCVPHLSKSLENTLDSTGSADHHELVAFWWIFANSRIDSALSSRFLCKMMSLTLVNESIIAFVDHAIASQSPEQLIQHIDAVKEGIRLIHAIFCGDKYCVKSSSPIDMSPNGKQSGPDGNMDFIKPRLSNGTHASVNLANRPLNAASIISSFIQLLESGRIVSEASENDKNTLRQEVENFLLAQISRMQAHFHAHNNRQYEHSAHQEASLGVTEQYSNNYTDLNLSASLTGFPHTFAFVVCLATQGGKDMCVSASQTSIFEDVRNGAANIYLLELELNKARISSPASRGGRSREHLAELLSYRKSQLGSAMEMLEKLGLGEEKLKLVRVVVHVAELAGTVFDVHLKG